MSTPQSNKSLREKGKQQAVLDWMRYFGTPKNLQRLTAEQGTYVPTWPGTSAKLGGLVQRSFNTNGFVVPS